MSKVLVIGGTGYLGKPIALASAAHGHPTFVLVRPSSAYKHESLLSSFQSAGIKLLQGSVDDHESLVAAIKQVDVVISTISSPFLEQLKIIEAIKEAGNIKRFFPSEFGNDIDRVHAVEPVKTHLFEPKVQVRRALEESGIPYTLVISNAFFGTFISNLLQTGLQAPPRDKVTIYGTGNVKFIAALEEDVAAYTIKAVDDPRTLNKSLHIRPPQNIVTMNALVELWEGMTGKELEKVTVSEEDMIKQIEETPFPANIMPALLHNVLIVGDQRSSDLGTTDVEATALYPDYKYTTIKEYLSKYL